MTMMFKLSVIIISLLLVQSSIALLTYRGVEGQDYPNYTRAPKTSFRCTGRPDGYYSDPEASCQAYHVCHSGRKHSFICPVSTLFNDVVKTCDYWYNVDCQKQHQGRSISTVNGETTVAPPPSPAQSARQRATTMTTTTTPVHPPPPQPEASARTSTHLHVLPTQPGRRQVVVIHVSDVNKGQQIGDVQHTVPPPRAPDFINPGEGRSYHPSATEKTGSAFDMATPDPTTTEKPVAVPQTPLEREGRSGHVHPHNERPKTGSAFDMSTPAATTPAWMSTSSSWTTFSSTDEKQESSTPKVGWTTYVPSNEGDETTTTKPILAEGEIQNTSSPFDLDMETGGGMMNESVVEASGVSGQSSTSKPHMNEMGVETTTMSSDFRKENWVEDGLPSTTESDIGRYHRRTHRQQPSRGVIGTLMEWVGAAASNNRLEVTSPDDGLSTPRPIPPPVTEGDGHPHAPYEVPYEGKKKEERVEIVNSSMIEEARPRSPLTTPSPSSTSISTSSSSSSSPSNPGEFDGAINSVDNEEGKEPGPWLFPIKDSPMNVIGSRTSRQSSSNDASEGGIPDGRRSRSTTSTPVPIYLPGQIGADGQCRCQVDSLYREGGGEDTYFS